MTDGAAYLLRGDARRIPLADASVDLIITSPPFFALRSYTDAGQHYPGQLGDEPTPAEFLANLWAATREMARVLKPSGSIWLELGDKYSSVAGGERGPNGSHSQKWIHDPQGRGTTVGGIRPKSLLGLPWAFALGCTGMLAMLGGPDPGLNLILRAEVIHEHVNGLPESVKDRVRRSHSTWFHMTKQARYYSAVDEVREAHTQRTHDQAAIDARAGLVPGSEYLGRRVEARQRSVTVPNPLGKLPGSVWSIPSEPLRVPEHLGIDHYAAFSSEIVRRIVLGWSPPGICRECGQGRAPVVEREIPDYRDLPQNPRDAGRYESTPVSGGLKASGLRKPGWRNLPDRSAQILGYVCACTPYTDHPGSGTTTRRDYNPVPDARPQGTYGRNQAGEYEPVGPWREYHLDGWKAPPTRPAVVLDPFAGTGTTVMVARALGRFGIGLDLSADYLRLATWRIWHSGDHAKAVSRTNLERQGSLL